MGDRSQDHERVEQRAGRTVHSTPGHRDLENCASPESVAPIARCSIWGFAPRGVDISRRRC